MEKVNELITEIRESKSTRSSQKDETRVMRAMLNDREYKVGVYDNEGLQGTFCPAEEARTLISSVLTTAASIKSAEAEAIAKDYEFKKSEANNFISISKEFVNTYMETGRRLPLGGREESDISLRQKEVPAGVKTFPMKVGVNEDGTSRYETRKTDTIGAHKSIRVMSPCPEWVK